MQFLKASLAIIKYFESEHYEQGMCCTIVDTWLMDAKAAAAVSRSYGHTPGQQTICHSYQHQISLFETCCHFHGEQLGGYFDF